MGSDAGFYVGRRWKAEMAAVEERQREREIDEALIYLRSMLSPSPMVTRALATIERALEDKRW